MPSKPKSVTKKPPRKTTKQAAPSGVPTALAWLERHGTKKTKDGMARYGIQAKKAFGVTMVDVRALAKQLGKQHELAGALWDSGWYEARLLTSFVAEPARLTQAEMDRWCKDFDNWAVCDTLCFHLFDRTPHAFGKVTKWSARREEFVKRAAFALLASLALHDKTAGDEPFIRCLPLVERAATDERNFVKKAVSWALRAIGGRNGRLNAAAAKLAKRLAASREATPRWIGKDALRDLASPATLRRVARG